MNLVQYLKSLDPEGFKKKVREEEQSKKERFFIGGQSGFKWNTHSGNKTWIENGKIVKEKKGKKLPLK